MKLLEQDVMPIFNPQELKNSLLKVDNESKVLDESKNSLDSHGEALDDEYKVADKPVVEDK